MGVQICVGKSESINFRSLMPTLAEKNIVDSGWKTVRKDKGLQREWDKRKYASL